MTQAHRISLKNVGHINPTKIEDYIAADGYQALKKALRMPAEKIVFELTQSGLRGRGGAGFSTGLKKQFTSEASCILLECMRYIVCNADEGEPGTFKDRIIMEGDPHLYIEGMIIAAYAVGARKGYIYIRGEYYQSTDMARNALDQASLAVALQTTKRSWLSFEVERVMYSEISAFPSRALPNRFLSLLGDSTSPSFDWEDLTVYTIGYTWSDGEDQQWHVDLSTRTQPSPSSRLLSRALEGDLASSAMTTIAMSSAVLV